jgi:glycosyltransferase XagB
MQAAKAPSGTERRVRAPPARHVVARGRQGEAGLGSDLVRRGVVAATDLLRALALPGAAPSALPHLLRSHRLAEDAELAEALAARAGLQRLGPSDGDPDPGLVARLGVTECVRLQVLPWRRAGSVTLLAVCDPEAIRPHLSALITRLGPLALVILSVQEMHAGLVRAAGPALAARAERSVPADESCRHWDGRAFARWGIAGVAALAAGLVLAPAATVLAALAVLMSVLVLTTALRLAAAIAALAARRRRGAVGRAARPSAAPVISILVPLLREPDIAPRLVRRLGALDWPRDRLDVLLVVEGDDDLTLGALARCRLPGWMRVVAVPPSDLRTKPRALNYALNFARGDIIGVYDAEDAPARGQLRAVAEAFAAGDPGLACVQGVLDYYNPHTNWMSRCFTIEYASWFRLVLPGLARLGLVVPLGGTTLFFRREALERLGGWDAHNVTEDADLGVRLARHGWRTELIASATLEEANCRALPWVRQRSRWLKGYAMTWFVHMRDPPLLWRQLGPWRFLGFQVLFLGTLIQFLLAPIFWTLWLVAMGLDWTGAAGLPPAAGTAVLGIVLSAEAIGMAVNFAALGAARHRGLRLWVPTLGFYFPLATIAAWRALWEMLARPFHWEKTEHGVDDAGHTPAEILP